jgi:hypothetical protein
MDRIGNNQHHTALDEWKMECLGSWYELMMTLVALVGKLLLASLRVIVLFIFGSIG